MYDVAGLAERWANRWPETPPVGHELRLSVPSRWVRLRSLPGSKRYPETDEERAVVLARHNTIVAELFTQLSDDCLPHEVLVFSAAWGDRSDPARRSDLVAVDRDATLWRSDRWDQSDPDLPWTHLWVSSRRWSPGALDPLLALVAEDRTAGIIVAPPSLTWLYHPYDGGADVIAPSEAARDQLATKHKEWLSDHHGGK